jgi:hypothetical protein
LAGKLAQLFRLGDKLLSSMSVCHNSALPLAPPLAPARQGGIFGIAFAKSSPDVGDKGANRFASDGNTDQ